MPSAFSTRANHQLLWHAFSACTLLPFMPGFAGSDNPAGGLPNRASAPHHAGAPLDGSKWSHFCSKGPRPMAGPTNYGPATASPNGSAATSASPPLPTTSGASGMPGGGFFLLAAVRRTWGPQGQTPILPAWDRRDRIWAISALTVRPVRPRLGLCFPLPPTNRNAKAPDVVAFRRPLEAARRGPRTVVWDRHGIHRQSGLVQAYLAPHPEIVAEDFPGSAPELNPDEQVGNWTKNGPLANRPADNCDGLFDPLVEGLTELQQRPDLLAAFVDPSGLQLKPHDESYQAVAG